MIGFVVFQFWGNAVRGYIDTPSVFWWWGWQWFNQESEAQHGLLVLALTGWLAWRNLSKPEVRGQQSAVTPIWPGIAAMLGGFALHLLGFAVQQTRISIVALMVFAWGVLRLGGGVRWGRATAFPIALLVFSIPVGVLDSVGFHLRLGVIATTEVIARAAGIEVLRNGTQLFSPDGSYQYDVAAACSGVRSLMAMLALAALVGYLGPRAWWRRGVVFLLAFPLTFIGNVVRIAGIVFAGEWLGQSAGEFVHDWAGFVVFLIVLVGVQMASGWIEERGSGPAKADQERHHNGDILAGRSLRIAWVVVTLSAFGTISLIERLENLGSSATPGIPLAVDGLNPAPLPQFIGTDWIGQEAEVTAVEREMLPEDTGYARRLYVSLDDRREQVFVSVVLSGRDRTSIHRPELCLVGQGWSIVGRSETVFGEDVPAALLRLEREWMTDSGHRARVPALFAYWFVGRDGVVTTTASRLWRTALNRLRLQPDRWAYVVVQAAVLPDETEQDARSRMERVAQPLLGQLSPRGSD